MTCYINDMTTSLTLFIHIGGSRGGTGVQTSPPLKNHKNIGLSSNTGPEPLINQDTIQCWAIISLPAKPNLNGILLASQWWPTFSGIWILSPSLSEEKEIDRVGIPLAKLSGSPYDSDEFSLTYWYNKNGIVHFVF